MVLCEYCQQRPATMHFTKIVNGEKSEHHLCEQCAREKGDFFAQAAQAFNFNNLLSGLLNTESSPGYPVATQAGLRCEVCGMTYQQFTQIGRFGCPHCYESFSPRLDPLLRRIQSSTRHTGKVPMRSGETVKTRRELDTLRRELKRAIMQEQYEDAAQIRDQIRTLEDQLDK